MALIATLNLPATTGKAIIAIFITVDKSLVTSSGSFLVEFTTAAIGEATHIIVTGVGAANVSTSVVKNFILCY